ncbi:MAG: thioredoxin-disulfide reductase [candidate division Zixibacteria bacterium]|nr:thioredoxin-disulfide reductase [candidate division Zixibacteria bacterium]
MSEIHNVIIIGSGPAGFTAALYASRANLNPLLLEGAEPGGQLMTTTDVENYPGFPEGLLGPDMMQKFREQAQKFGTTILLKTVTKVDFTKPPFKLWADGEEYEARTVIIATGASAKTLGLEAEQKLMGYGMSACAVCDGFFFKGKDVIVVGGGDSAMEEAIFLTKFASRVTVVHRRDKLRASKIMQERARKNFKIDFIWDTTLIDVFGDREGGVKSVKLKNLKTNKVEDRTAGGVFYAIGHDPNTEPFKGSLELDRAGYIITKNGTTATSVTGVFAGGDVVDHRYRQAVTAAGMGCMAAMDAEKYLESLH